MNLTSLVSRLSSLLLLAGAAAFSGCETTPDKDPSTTKVLMIGNSFSICCLRHLPSVAEDAGVDLDLASLYIGGCTLRQHWANATNETIRPYRYDRIVRGVRVADCAKRNICETLRETKWDYVTIQQGSHESWKPASFSPFGDDLVALIRRLAPQAKIVVQETWSYTPWDARLAKWGIDQNKMYAELHAAYGAFAKRYGLQVIPFGTAVQAWRRRLPVRYSDHSFGGDVVGGGRQAEADQFKRDGLNRWSPNCDVFHLGRKGEYFQALVWASSLLGVDPENVDYKPDFVTDDEAKLMKQIAGGK